ncbi:hypothetical protein [Roseomonas sp. BN140053]|uniref:hypothetical protein n=1 Tax=Roseomonas sp. BN140053 TaxID=3391898 RepID=UPI0039E82A66
MEKLGWLQDGKGDIELIELNRYLKARGEAEVFDISFFYDVNQPIITETHQVLSKNLEEALRQEQVTEKFRIIWLMDDQLNAMALQTVLCEERLIFINFGCYFILMNFFQSLMASPTFATTIGNVGLDEMGPKIEVVSNATAVVTNRTGRISKCPTRYFFGGLLATTALHFLLFHELTHLVNGHEALDGLSSESTRQDYSTQNIKGHTLEMDADSGAVIKIFNQMFQGVFGRGGELRAGTPNIEHYYSVRDSLGIGIQSVCKILSIAMVGVFTLFNPRRLGKENMFNGSHPNAFLRQVMAGSVLSGHVKRYGGNGAAEEALSETHIAFRDIYSEIDFREQSKGVMESILEFINSDAFEYYNCRLNKCWRDELHSLLKQRKISKAKLAIPKGELNC